MECPFIYYCANFQLIVSILDWRMEKRNMNIIPRLCRIVCRIHIPPFHINAYFPLFDQICNSYSYILHVAIFLSPPPPPHLHWQLGTRKSFCVLYVRYGWLFDNNTGGAFHTQGRPRSGYWNHLKIAIRSDMILPMGNCPH